MNDGDWICSDANCGNINFARRTSCYRCNKERPDSAKACKKKLGTEIGKTAAEKSRGLFNADDWQCNKCANVNWARRQTCNVCNAPKFGEVEARTGYGGGYNERGAVEYRRREASSDDEYDEFGRKKRKRKPESQEKVGITEAAVIKKLPPSVQQKETKKDHVMPALGPNKSRPNTRPQEKVKGSLSDGSVCDVVPLSKAIVSKYEQLNVNRQDNVPFVKTNGVPTRKRFISSGDRDQTASSGYETCTKKSKRDNTISPIIKYNPVMENMVSSTNNDVVYKFTGPTPAEDFQVTYTIEERVKAAAFAIVYNNCRISTDKFEALYDKPAPDFKTIFGWRQRLMTTGCLVDSHVDKKDITDKPVADVAPKTDIKPVSKIPNPDEIILSSDSDEEINNIQQKPLPRSVSAETLLIAADKSVQPAGSAASTGDDRASRDRSHSRSSRRRTRSSSTDSEESSYPDSDSEKTGAKSTNSRSASCSKSARQSIKNSDSDSVSYNSEDDNFLSRVFPNREDRKRRKIKRRTVVAPAPPVIVSNYVPNEPQSFEGYSTVKPTEKSPLVTGNIYTMNLRNMNVKPRTNISVDIDNCSSEYVPTKLGSTANKNYQDFKKSVRRKGFWAKGNSTNIVKNRHSISMDVANIPRPVTMKPQERTVPNYSTNIQCYNTPQHRLAKSQTTDFTKDDIEQFSYTEQYLPFESSQARPQDKRLRPLTIIPGQMKPVQMIQSHKPATKPIQMVPQTVQVKTAQTPLQIVPVPISLVPKALENTDRIFALVQSNSAEKNRSIMDIFGNNGTQKSPDREKELEKYDSVRKMYETWDEDDDALYKDTDSAQMQSPKRPTPSPLSINSARGESPMSNMLYTSDNQSLQEVTINATVDLIQDKQDILLDLLKDFQNKEIGEVLSPIKQITPQKQVTTQKHSTPQRKIEEKIMRHKAQINAMTNLYNRPEPIPTELSHEVLRMSGDIDNSEDNYCEQNTVKQISPSKKVHVLESVTIKPGSTSNDGSPKQLDDNTKAAAAIQQVVESCEESPEKITQQVHPATQPASELNLSNLLAGINTNTLLLALQNLQQFSQNSSLNSSKQDNTEQQSSSQNAQAVETINLTNDEDWEKESNRDGSIERQLQKLDGNTGDAHFLGDIFDPDPVRILPNVARKLNLSVDNLEDKSDNLTHNENAAVIGNFKSFALPKPILLNRLKIPVKTIDKPKRSDVKKIKRKKKSKSGSSHEAAEGEEDDEEESGDEADLSKYDLWGSDAEQGNSSKTDNGARSKDGEDPKEVEPKSPTEKCDKNDRNASPASKSSKRRSRSSSSSSTSSSSSSSSQSSSQEHQNKFDDFNLNSERESSPKGRKSRSRSRSPRARSTGRRKSRDSRSAGESRSHEPRDKEWSRDRERRDRSRGNREDRKERRYSRDGGNHYSSRGRHR